MHRHPACWHHLRSKLRGGRQHPEGADLMLPRRGTSQARRRCWTYPLDVLSPAPGAVRLLEYPDGRAAAVGHPGSVAVLGFALESLENGARDSLLAALLQFLGV